MAMRTASPWWASLTFGIGLMLLFISERLLQTTEGMRVAMSGLAVTLLVVVTAARAWAMLGSRGARRRVEFVLLACHLVTLLALVVYALSSKWGEGLFHVGEKAHARYTGALTVVWVILLIASVLPVLMIELSLGGALRGGFDVQTRDDDAGVELYRVREMGWSGLTIALAMSLLMVTCGVAKERNVQRDVSYFKTSSPGESTRNIVKNSSEPITVHLFFPDTNEVKDQVKSYFDALAAATGKLSVEVNDRQVNSGLAQKYQVNKDGVVVLSRGAGDKEKFFKFDEDTDIEKARKGSGKLRNLDHDVNAQLMKLARDKRKAYLVTGHGEMTNPESVPPDVVVEPRRTVTFRKYLGDLNYEIKDLGLADLSKDVPADAAVVLLIRPTVALLNQEWAALDRYVANGGRLLVALDPTGVTSMGPLEGRLGVRMIEGGRLLDDKNNMRTRGNDSDARWEVTSEFVSHATTTSISKQRSLNYVDGGALEDVMPTGKDAPKKTYTVRSMDTAWLDFDGNLKYDPQGVKPEKKQKWNLGAAIEGPATKDAKGGDKDGYRAVVFADADLFADVTVQDMTGRVGTIMYSYLLLADVVRWLGGEEVFSGEIVSEDDKPINHTKDQDAKWFTLTMLAAPALVLTLGLVGTWARRRRSKKVQVRS